MANASFFTPLILQNVRTLTHCSPDSWTIAGTLTTRGAINCRKRHYHYPSTLDVAEEKQITASE